MLQVQQHWHRYTEKMDKMVEEAFRLNVKWSLQELSKAINGDGKSAPNPLFRGETASELSTSHVQHGILFSSVHSRQNTDVFACKEDCYNYDV